MDIFKRTYLVFVVCYLSIIICVSCKKFTATRCDYTIERIDAITNFTNGSLFVSSGPYYWILNHNEKPIQENAKMLHQLIPGVSKLESAVNIRIINNKTTGTCHSIDEQLVFYSENYNDTTGVVKYENGQWKSYGNASDFEVFENINTHIDWNEKIDAIAYFEKIIVIFQGQKYVTIRCEGRKWVEAKSTDIKSTFGNINGPIDSALFVNVESTIEEAFLYMFLNKNYYICPIYGLEPCSGPFSISDEFFKFKDSQFCNSDIQYELTSLIGSIGLIVALVIFVIVIGYLLTSRSRQITFWVNSHRKRTNETEQQLRRSYESLKPQTETELNGESAIPFINNGKGNSDKVVTDV